MTWERQSVAGRNHTATSQEAYQQARPSIPFKAVGGGAFDLLFELSRVKNRVVDVEVNKEKLQQVRRLFGADVGREQPALRASAILSTKQAQETTMWAKVIKTANGSVENGLDVDEAGFERLVDVMDSQVRAHILRRRGQAMLSALDGAKCGSAPVEYLAQRLEIIEALEDGKTGGIKACGRKSDHSSISGLWRGQDGTFLIDCAVRALDLQGDARRAGGMLVVALCSPAAAGHAGLCGTLPGIRGSALSKA
ncbi:hypothetical protein DDE82_008888 [Stemphylium lycopersici]|nr:hypothetical protein DDE82_008888 [Stemphylium lycopersici]